jgi:hypothetical protein
MCLRQQRPCDRRKCTMVVPLQGAHKRHLRRFVLLRRVATRAKLLRRFATVVNATANHIMHHYKNHIHIHTWAEVISTNLRTVESGESPVWYPQLSFGIVSLSTHIILVPSHLRVSGTSHMFSSPFRTSLCLAR